MGQLQQRDLRAALDFLGDVDSRSLEGFRASVIGGIRRLVPCDVATYDEIDPSTGEVMWITDPGEFATVADTDAFVRNIDQHAVVQHHLSRDGAPRTVSDFYSRRQWHGTALYNEFFRPLNLETQVATLWSGPNPAIVATSLNRVRGDPSERDRLVLDLVRPHVGSAFAAARARTRSERLVESLAEGADRAGASVVVLSDSGRIEAASAGARRRLRAFFGPAASPDCLPEELVRWVALHPTGVLARTRDGVLLRIRFMARSAPLEPDVLLLEERPPSPTPELLRGLGLTRRQAEVLALIAAGKSNREIAEALTISPLTAKKHAENIYAKLGTPGRAAAAARAHQVSAAAACSRPAPASRR